MQVEEPEITFARRLRGLRAEKDLSQEELAQSVGVSRESIQNWEKAEYMPGLSIAVKLADILCCPLDYLVGRGS